MRCADTTFAGATNRARLGEVCEVVRDSRRKNVRIGVTSEFLARCLFLGPPSSAGLHGFINHVGSSNSERKRPGRGSAVTPAERVAIQGLSISGLSNAEIARRQGRSRKTIARVLSSEEFRLARDMARSALMQGAVEFVADWRRASREAAKRGRHEPARDALLGLNVIEPPSAKPDMGVVVHIGMALPGLGLKTDGPIQIQTEGSGQVIEGHVEYPNDAV